ncbi:condensation domain-containing protein, partial [Priestia sp. SIMBA_032]|uniref:condensation domain-containing protein n=1 Tax=Priestia sp. SIMBA_032 TaxID=3085775 RepID=UPI00397D2668
SAVAPFAEHDLRSDPEAEGRRAGILDEDRTRRFEMDRAPLMRFTAIRLDENRVDFVMTSHHILLDGWSMPLVLRELFTLYATSGDATVLP